MKRLETPSRYVRAATRAYDRIVWFCRRHESLVLVALVAFHAAIPLLVGGLGHDLPNEEIYRSLAKNLATTGHYSTEIPTLYHRPSDPFTSFAPGWPAVLALGYIVAGARGFWLALGLVWAFGFGATYVLAKVLRLGSRARWLLLFWFTSNPTLLFYHCHLMTEPLALVLGEAILISGILWVRRPSWKAIALVGVISALGHLERTMLVLPALAVLVVGFRVLPWKRYALMIAVFVAVHLAVVAPWLLRMHAVHAGMTATELKLGHNLYMFSNPYVENPVRPRPDESFNWPTDLESKTPAERNTELVRRSVEGIRENPLRYLRNCGRRLYYELAPWPSFTAMSRAQATALTGSALLFMYGCWALFFVSLRRGARLTPEGWVLLTALLFWYGGHCLLASSVRMRFPSDPWLPALALAARGAGVRRRLEAYTDARA